MRSRDKQIPRSPFQTPIYSHLTESGNEYEENLEAKWGDGKKIIQRLGYQNKGEPEIRLSDLKVAHVKDQLHWCLMPLWAQKKLSRKVGEGKCFRSRKACICTFWFGMSEYISRNAKEFCGFWAVLEFLHPKIQTKWLPKKTVGCTSAP